MCLFLFFFFFQAEDGIRDLTVTGVQTCALPIFVGAGCLFALAGALRPGQVLLWGKLGDRLRSERTAPTFPSAKSISTPAFPGQCRRTRKLCVLLMAACKKAGHPEVTGLFARGHQDRKSTRLNS